MIPQIAKLTGGNWPQLLLILFITALAIYFLLRNKDKADQRRAERKLDENRGEVSGGGSVVLVNYTAGQYQDFANQLEGAMRGVGTDEDAIEAVILKLKSNADAARLNEAFGIRDKHSLGSWLNSDGELREVNNMLEAQGITYRFPLIDERSRLEKLIG